MGAKAGGHIVMNGVPVKLSQNKDEVIVEVRDKQPEKKRALCPPAASVPDSPPRYKSALQIDATAPSQQHATAALSGAAAADAALPAPPPSYEDVEEVKRRPETGCSLEE